MLHTSLAWGICLLSLCLMVLALKRMRGWLARSFIVGGAMLMAAAGFANGLVMSCNGGRMPVESSYVIEAPHFLSGPGDEDGLACRAIQKALKLSSLSEIEPGGDEAYHTEVPDPPRPSPRGSKAPQVFVPQEPSLAFLDDREPVVICGEYNTLSKGDIMGGIGTLQIAVGILLWIASGLLGLVLRRFRKKKDGPSRR